MHDKASIILPTELSPPASERERSDRDPECELYRDKGEEEREGGSN